MELGQIRAHGPPVELVLLRRASELSVQHKLARPGLLAPLGSTRVQATGHGEVWRDLDAGAVLVLPAGNVQIEAIGPRIELCILSWHEQAFIRVCEEYRGEVKPEVLRAMVRTPSYWPRTTWLHELLHRYVFERSICSRHGSCAATFCEVELLKELAHFADARARRASERPSQLKRARPLTEHALALIEAELFAPFDVRRLAQRCGCSRSTLTRAFRADTGTSPALYARQRRLDESRLLLQSGRYSVTDVALLIGYTTTAAFSHAFSRRFGHAPSTVPRT